MRKAFNNYKMKVGDTKKVNRTIPIDIEIREWVEKGVVFIKQYDKLSDNDNFFDIVNLIKKQIDFNKVTIIRIDVDISSKEMEIFLNLFRNVKTISILNSNLYRIPNLKSLNKLERFTYINNREITRDIMFLERFDNLPKNITNITISGVNIEIGRVDMYKKLESLDLNNSVIPYFPILKCPKLKILNINGTHSGFYRFDETLPHLIVESLNGDILDGLKNIDLINMDYNEAVAITFRTSIYIGDNVDKGVSLKNLNKKFGKLRRNCNFIIDRERQYQQNSNTVYNHKENVHSSSINTSILTSIKKIMVREEVGKINLDLFLEDLSKESKYIIKEDCLRFTSEAIETYSYTDILNKVCSIIHANNNHIELKKILETEIISSKSLCFTGCVSRIVNSLSGFDDDVVVNISDREQMNSVIVNEKNKLGDDYTVIEHKQNSIKVLTELGYDLNKIKEFTDFIE